PQPDKAPPMPMAGGNETPPDKGGNEQPMPNQGTKPQSEKVLPPAAGNDPKQEQVKKEAERINQELSKQQQQPGATARGGDDQRPEHGQPAGERKGQPGGGSPPADPKSAEKNDQPGT